MISFEVPWPPPYEGPPLPFSVNRKRAVIVDMAGVFFCEEEVETPIHPSVESYQLYVMSESSWRTPGIFWPWGGVRV